ncbi:hypothetical protein HMPREF0198_2381 [Cardiobacterium hominis ATCC 15826]|uniref:Uncharacterized protein n=1 Tax=Cardiobacterium hominis (strain ATCC 15826 / DSM 8339 / NCTC 10426 / 6573) TaxID=638300 RepID=C8ND03_CARH6|nr:hypothetical protein HMPREF0198_2381 [Cardiobacterium hominis ATCC 15826]
MTHPIITTQNQTIKRQPSKNKPSQKTTNPSSIPPKTQKTTTTHKIHTR